MLRSFMAVMVATVAATPTGVAADPPGTGKATAYYFPTTVGTKWVTTVQRTGGAKPDSFDISFAVTKAEAVEGAVRVTVEAKVGASDYPTIEYEVSGTGVSVVSRTFGKVLTKPAVPETHLKLPAKAGDTWTFTRENPVAEAPVRKITYTVGKAEDVEVPAGKFETISVTQTETSAGVRSDITTWYAPGVGAVKATAKSSHGDGGGSHVLKSFTPAK